MILTCPACTARYSAKDEAFLPSGRTVRCAKCGHSWFQEAPGAAQPAVEPVQPPPPAPSPPEPVRAEPPPQPDAPPTPPVQREARAAVIDDTAFEVPQVAVPAARPRRRSNHAAIFAGWALLVLTIAALATGAVVFRQKIARAWPQTSSLYAAMGMPVNVEGLAFDDVLYHRQSEDNQTVLAVSGTLVNVTAHRLSVPPIRVVLNAADGKELYSWQFQPPVAVLAPRSRVPFKTRLSNPPDAARHLTLEFAAPKGGE